MSRLTHNKITNDQTHNFWNGLVAKFPRWLSRFRTLFVLSLNQAINLKLLFELKVYHKTYISYGNFFIVNYWNFYNTFTFSKQDANQSIQLLNSRANRTTYCSPTSELSLDSFCKFTWRSYKTVFDYNLSHSVRDVYFVFWLSMKFNFSLFNYSRNCAQHEKS